MKTIEEIVKEKQYFELTNDELVLVSELAQNQDEYDQLRHLLVESQSFYDQNKVAAGQGMRDHIMEKLYPPTIIEPIAWYNSLWLFLFPPRKPFYKYPAFQIAGVLILLLGIFSILDDPFKEEDLAQNTIEDQDELVKKESVKKIDKVKLDDDIIIEEHNNNLTPEVPTNSNLIEEKNDNEFHLDVNTEDDLSSSSAELKELSFEEEILPVPVEDLSDERFVVSDNEPSVQVSSSNLNSYSKDKFVENEKITTTSPKRELGVVEISKADDNSSKKFKKVKEEGNKTLFYDSESTTAGGRKNILSKNNSITEINGITKLFFEVK